MSELLTDAPKPKRLRGWLTTKEAARAMGLTPSRIRQFYLEGRLPGTKKGRDLYFHSRDLDRVRDRRPGRPSGPAWRGRRYTRQPRDAAGLEPRLDPLELAS
jgi:excisionase family DNA binding protein